MIITPQGLLPSWPPDYICYAVELHREYDKGLISKAEAMSRLSERFPGHDEPDARTWRRWAHEKYPDLPERRQRFLSPQETACGLNYQSGACGFQGIQGQFIRPVLPAQTVISPLIWELVNWMVFCVMLSMLAAMARMVLSSL